MPCTILIKIFRNLIQFIYSTQLDHSVGDQQAWFASHEHCRDKACRKVSRQQLDSSSSREVTTIKKMKEYGTEFVNVEKVAYKN